MITMWPQSLKVIISTLNNLANTINQRYFAIYLKDQKTGGQFTSRIKGQVTIRLIPTNKSLSLNELRSITFIAKSSN